MEENSSANSHGVSLSASEWATEVNKLTERFRDTNMIVQILSPFLVLRATGFRPLVDKQTLHVPLRPGSPEGSASGVVSVSLPLEEQGQYLKFANESNEVLLSAGYLIGNPKEPAGEVLVRLATSVEFFCCVTGEARTQ